MSSLRGDDVVDGVRRLFIRWYSVCQTETCLRQQVGVLRRCTFLATTHHQHFEIRVEHAQRQLLVIGDGALDDVLRLRRGKP